MLRALLIVSLGTVGVILLVAAWRLFRRMAIGQSEPDTPAPEPFTLQGLRQMLAEGLISRSEFESLKGALLEKYADKNKREESSGPR